MKFKNGDVYESPSGLTAVVTAVEKKGVTFDVDRNVRDRDKKMKLEVHSRHVLFENMKYFLAPYRKVE